MSCSTSAWLHRGQDVVLDLAVPWNGWNGETIRIRCHRVCKPGACVGRNTVGKQGSKFSSHRRRRHALRTLSLVPRTTHSTRASFAGLTHSTASPSCCIAPESASQPSPPSSLRLSLSVLCSRRRRRAVVEEQEWLPPLLHRRRSSLRTCSPSRQSTRVRLISSPPSVRESERGDEADHRPVGLRSQTARSLTAVCKRLSRADPGNPSPPAS